MIRCTIPGFIDSDFSSGGSRLGDCQIFKSDYVDIVDGYCGSAARRLIKRLKALGIKDVYLHISHAHYDHYNGIEMMIDDEYFNVIALYCYDPKTLNANFSKDCAENVAALNRIINKAKKRGSKIVFLKDGDKIIHGDTEIWVYRDQPTTAPNTDAYINDGSLCYYFPKLKYLSTGDSGLWCAERHKLDVKFFKGGHHDNDNSGDTKKPSEMCRWLKQRGCEFFWDNDYSTTLTDFLMTGREDALNAGMKFIDIHGDTNFLACNGKVTIYKGTQHWTYKCDYKGKNTLKSPTLGIVKSVLRGDIGNSDTRTTNLLDKGFSPVGVQNQVNELYKLIKG